MDTKRFGNTAVATPKRQFASRGLAIVAGITVGTTGALGGGDYLSPRALASAIASWQGENAPRFAPQLERVLAIVPMPDRAEAPRRPQRAMPSLAGESDDPPRAMPMPAAPVAAPAVDPVAAPSSTQAPVAPAPAPVAAPAAAKVPAAAAPARQSPPAAAPKPVVAAVETHIDVMAPEFIAARPLVVPGIPRPDTSARADVVSPPAHVSAPSAAEGVEVFTTSGGGRGTERPAMASTPRPVAPAPVTSAAAPVAPAVETKAAPAAPVRVAAADTSFAIVPASSTRAAAPAVAAPAPAVPALSQEASFALASVAPPRAATDDPAADISLIIPDKVFPGREAETKAETGITVEVPLPRRRADVAPPPPPTPAERLGLTGQERAKAERCLSQAIYFEARNEPVRGQIAVAQVVLNRVFSPYYPKDICSVVYQNAHRFLSCQFTFACDGIPEAVRERGAWSRAHRIAKQTLDGKLWLDDVAKATHYHAVYVSPYWVREMRKMVRHGRHTFYRPRRWGDGANEPGWVRPPGGARSS